MSRHRHQPGYPHQPALHVQPAHKVLQRVNAVLEEAQSELKPQSTHLLDGSWKFLGQLPSQLTANGDFLVVGVLGGPQSGKSTFLNKLLGLHRGSSSLTRPFPVGSSDPISLCQQTTTGIDMRVSYDRVIGLDTMPLGSPSALLQLLDSGRPPAAIERATGDSSVSAEASLEMLQIFIALFLFRVCHVVVIMTTGLDDTKLWEFVQTIEMLLHSIPDVISWQPQASDQDRRAGHKGSRSQSQKEDAPATLRHAAEPIFVHSRLCPEELEAYRCSLASSALDLAFQRSGLCQGAKISYPPREASREVGSAKAAESIGVVPKKVANFFVLPEAVGAGEGFRREGSGKGSEGGSGLGLSYGAAVDELCKGILSMPRRPFGTVISEVAWFEGCRVVWDKIQRSQDIKEYFRVLQGTKYKDVASYY